MRPRAASFFRRRYDVLFLVFTVFALSALAQVRANLGGFALFLLSVAAIPMFATSFSCLLGLSMVSVLPALLLGLIMLIPSGGIAFIGFVLFAVPFVIGVVGRSFSLVLENLSLRRPYSLIVEFALLLLVYHFAITV